MLLDPFLKHQPPGYRNRLADAPAFYWIYVEEGRLFFRAGHEAHELGRDRCLVLPRGCHGELWTAAGQGYRGVSITVLPPEGWEWPSPSAAPLAVNGNLRSLARLLSGILRDPDGRSMTMARHLAQAILEESRHLCRKRPTATHPDFTSAMLDGVEIALRQGIYSGEPVSGALKVPGWSLRQVQRLFHARHGLSAKAWQMKEKMAAAGEWLRRPGMPVQVVARELGFASGQHLSTAFRRHHGMSPKAWAGAIHREPDNGG